MSFLSIAFLTALPLVLAPVVLHLFDRRRHVVIEWGAMQFLMDAATRRTSARKLKQWLLLLLRTLAIACLIFALARPLVPGNWFGGGERTELVLVIDNSLSMRRTLDPEGEGSTENENSTLLAKALQQATDEIGRLSAGDTVRVLTTSPYPSWITSGSLRAEGEGAKMATEAVASVRATGGDSDVMAGLFTATQAETQPLTTRRRIVLLTDRQANDWNLDETRSWDRFQSSLADAPLPTTIEIVTPFENDTTHTRLAQNIAVTSLTANRLTVGSDRPFKLTAELHNHGDASTSNAAAVWTIDGDPLHESDVPAIEPRASRNIEWTHSLTEPGVYAIRCEVDTSDALPADNMGTVVIEVVDRLPILIVEGNPDGAELQRDAFLVETALGWQDGSPASANTVYAPTVVTAERLEFLDLADFHAVVVPNLSELGTGVVDRLEAFVASGGGLWIGLGARTDIDLFNKRLFADGGGLAPLRLDTIVEHRTDTADPSRTKINPFMKGHPATTLLSDDDQLDLADVTVRQRFRFGAAPPGEDPPILLSLTNGQPLAVENNFGRGRVVVQGVPLRLSWSSLARSQAFVVMIHEVLGYLTQPLQTRHNLSPGDPLRWRSPDANTQTATLRTPSGDVIELTAEPTGNGSLFQTSRTRLPGLYRLGTGIDDSEIPFYVTGSAAESDLTPLTSEQQLRIAERVEPANVTTSDAAPSASGYEPLWPLLLGVLVIILAAELLLAGLISRERFGSDPIAESNEMTGDSFPLMSGLGDRTTSASRPVDQSAPAPQPSERPLTPAS